MVSRQSQAQCEVEEVVAAPAMLIGKEEGSSCGVEVVRRYRRPCERQQRCTPECRMINVSHFMRPHSASSSRQSYREHACSAVSPMI